jgi:hypothetical protein
VGSLSLPPPLRFQEFEVQWLHGKLTFYPNRPVAPSPFPPHASRSMFTYIGHVPHIQCCYFLSDPNKYDRKSYQLLRRVATRVSIFLWAPVFPMLDPVLHVILFGSVLLRIGCSADCPLVSWRKEGATCLGFFCNVSSKWLQVPMIAALTTQVQKASFQSATL